MTDFNELLKTPDGSLWAKAFVETVSKNPAIATDQASMEAWFCNAIMVGYDFKQTHQIVKLRSTQSNPLGGWEVNTLAEVVKINGAEIVVRLLDETLQKGVSQDEAINKGYPVGYLIVKSENISVS